MQACADKIAREMQDFGNPPVFPAQEEAEVVEEKSEVGFFFSLIIRVINFSPHTGDYQGQVQGQEE